MEAAKTYQDKLYSLTSGSPFLSREDYRDKFSNEVTIAKAMEMQRQAGYPYEEFDVRSGPYDLALQFAKNARWRELKALLDLLKPERTQRGMDVAAGTGFSAIPLALLVKPRSLRVLVDRVLPHDLTRIYATDPSKKQLERLTVHANEASLGRYVKAINISPDHVYFHDEVRERYCKNLVGKLDFAASIGGLHHSQDHLTLFANVARSLKVGGRFVFLDVRRNSPVMDWFEKVVSPTSITGHEGNWLDEGVINKLCHTLPFQARKMNMVDVFWEFTNGYDAGSFLEGLHAHDPDKLSLADTISEANKHLGLSNQPSVDTLRKNLDIREKVFLYWPLFAVELQKIKGTV